MQKVHGKLRCVALRAKWNIENEEDLDQAQKLVCSKRAALDENLAALPEVQFFFSCVTGKLKIILSFCVFGIKLLYISLI